MEFLWPKVCHWNSAFPVIYCTEDPFFTYEKGQYLITFIQSQFLYKVRYQQFVKDPLKIQHWNWIKQKDDKLIILLTRLRYLNINYCLYLHEIPISRGLPSTFELFEK